MKKVFSLSKCTMHFFGIKKGHLKKTLFKNHWESESSLPSFTKCYLVRGAGELNGLYLHAACGKCMQSEGGGNAWASPFKSHLVLGPEAWITVRGKNVNNGREEGARDKMWR